MYILVRKNQVIDYCDSGYSYVGNVVVCESKGCSFEDATIVDIGDTSLPADIDCGSYQYLHGEFIRTPDPVDIVKKSIVVETELLTSSWSNGIYKLYHENITSTNVVELIPPTDITLDELDLLQSANIIGGTQSNGSLELKAMGDIPSKDIPITLIIRGDL